MSQNQNQSEDKPKKVKLIYNPHAGRKRSLFAKGKSVSLEDIKGLLEQYHIPVDYAPTKRPGHATELAKESINEGYNLVLAAGGDGTISEVANGLVNSDMTLGLLPMGSFMNIARMLSIPRDLEKAIALIKIGRTRKIDVGVVTKLDGEKLSTPSYFLEGAGIGIEANFQHKFLDFERGNKKALIDLFHTLADTYNHPVKIYLDDEEMETKAIMVTVSNGPFTGAALELAPKAKLNDHKLTVSLFKMTKLELAKYFLHMKRNNKTYSPKIKTYQASKVKLITGRDSIIHADARVFGTTPAEFKILPSALNVITGFPKPGFDKALLKRTLLDS